MKSKKLWVCYKADMELNEDDLVLVRSDDKTVFTGRVVCDDNSEIIVRFDIGINTFDQIGFIILICVKNTCNFSKFT